jgi:hypothetical protein
MMVSEAARYGRASQGRVHGLRGSCAPAKTSKEGKIGYTGTRHKGIHLFHWQRSHLDVPERLHEHLSHEHSLQRCRHMKERAWNEETWHTAQSRAAPAHLHRPIKVRRVGS